MVGCLLRMTMGFINNILKQLLLGRSEDEKHGWQLRTSSDKSSSWLPKWAHERSWQGDPGTRAGMYFNNSGSIDERPSVETIMEDEGTQGMPS